MTRIRRIAAALAFVLACVLPPLGAAQAATSATANLVALDKSLKSGWIDARIEFYPAPDAKGNIGQPQVFPAQLLFARPGQFRLVLRTGAKNEYRAAASGGVVSWIDYGTGMGGQSKYQDLMDPFTRSMLDITGAITRFTPAKEQALDPKGPLRGAAMRTRVYGSSVVASHAWFANDQPTGFDFTLSDQRRVVVSVLAFKPNVATKPGDFRL